MSPKARVLVAEDEAGVRELIRTQLVMAGYDVHVARDGRDAVERVRELKPDALVLDLNMPKLDGFQVLESVGQLAPTLVVSARHAPGDVARAVKAGAKDYLRKPFTQAQLISRMTRLLRRRPTQEDDALLV
jgi:two-component system OmpR family response regulator